MEATPEERVRASFLHFLLDLGYPKHALAVEVPLEGLARRADIVCWSNVHIPLLLVECKAYAPKAQDLPQLHGYNLHVRAPFVALVGPSGFLFFGQGQTSSAFPSYTELLEIMESIN